MHTLPSSMEIVLVSVLKQPGVIFAASPQRGQSGWSSKRPLIPVIPRNKVEDRPKCPMRAKLPRNPVFGPERRSRKPGPRSNSIPFHSRQLRASPREIRNMPDWEIHGKDCPSFSKRPMSPGYDFTMGTPPIGDSGSRGPLWPLRLYLTGTDCRQWRDSHAWRL
jgi:hypothetical protein